MSQCKHENFTAEVDVNRITAEEDAQGKPIGDPHRWMADVRIRCLDCGTPMRFIGLPAGLDLNSPCVALNAEEARLPIAPRGHVLSELEGGRPSGFSVRRTV